ncbi:HTH-type transcriptional activator RhaS [Trinickia soli]|uniref:AraC family transcriptional regulator n=1 Tax=Trinickia soli TaxID=380675 RepID=A0A2N7W3U9_9BURK|nr:helix-turn-helix domain-containing protein [Paraburkholderia sp. T12-10]PMS24075.1 AraC family transcriptional regulator [Trinickia soli]CAB3702102.1 HTH-type transcriptional activator RhaS [Trinickia soli]
MMITMMHRNTQCVHHAEECFVDRATVFTSPHLVPREMTSLADARHIGILIFDGHCLFTTGVISEVFQLANGLMRFSSGQPPYRVSLLSKLGGPVTSSSSIAVMTQRLDAYSVGDFHALYVASNDVRVTSGFDVQLARWLSGSATAGHASASRHPSAFGVGIGQHTRPSVPVFWIGSGSMPAWALNQKAAQMALTQIASDHGEDMSLRIASSLPPSVGEVVKARNDTPSLNTTVDKIHESTRWMRENFGGDISVSDAAAVAAMSVRNYLRRFKSEFGVTPLEYLMQLRFEAICAMLVGTKLPVDKIARRCGMGNGDRLGRLFRKRYGVSPTIYRKHALSQ